MGDVIEDERMRSFYVYMLKCSDGSYYTGVTFDYQLRLRQHQAGVHPSCYTFHRRPVRLVYAAEFREVLDAIAWEKSLKGWSRKKKEALIQNDEATLKRLSRRRAGRPTCVSSCTYAAHVGI